MLPLDAEVAVTFVWESGVLPTAPLFPARLTRAQREEPAPWSRLLVRFELARAKGLRVYRRWYPMPP